MVRKSAWLLSARSLQFQTSALRRMTSTPPHQVRDHAAGRSHDRSQGRRATAGIRAGPGAPAATGRRQADRSLSRRRGAARCCPGRADRRDRRGGDEMQNSRRHRHPPAQPARAVTAGLLDRLRSQRLGPYPRHRHGRRQSRPRKLGRGVHRRRLSLAFGHRPQRARRDRPGRSAARAAGHPVRPQRLGRPDQHHHQEAAVHFRRLWRSDDRQLRSTPLRRRHHRAAVATRSRRGWTRSMSSATASTTIRPTTRRSTTATAFSSAASCCSSRPTSSAFRLIGDYTYRNERCCAAVYVDNSVNSNIGNLNEVANPLQQPGRFQGVPTTAATTSSMCCATLVRAIRRVEETGKK